MRIVALLTVLVLCPAAAMASPQGDAAEARRYRTCLAKAHSTPSAAYEEALAWQSEGGGAPALHCVAMALLGLRAYADGAEKLEALAYSPDISSPELADAALIQAGEAWLQAGRPADAVRVLDRALQHQPGNVPALINRARALRALGKVQAAGKDLDAVLNVQPHNALALRLRAALRLSTRDLAGAQRDIDAALASEPDNIESLVLRGQIREALRTR